jgi:hypothetical protein
MARRIELVIYGIGAAAFALIYQPFKSAFGSGVLFSIGVIAYLVLLNIACRLARRYIESRRSE